MFDRVDMDQAVRDAATDCLTHPGNSAGLSHDVYELDFEVFKTWIGAQVQENFDPFDPVGYSMAMFHLGYAWRRFQERRNGTRDVYLVFQQGRATPGNAVIGEGPPVFEFVEAEDDDGKSIKVGEWQQREDGYWVLKVKQAVPS